MRVLLFLTISTPGLVCAVTTLPEFFSCSCLCPVSACLSCSAWISDRPLMDETLRGTLFSPPLPLFPLWAPQSANPLNFLQKPHLPPLWPHSLLCFSHKDTWESDPLPPPTVYRGVSETCVAHSRASRVGRQGAHSRDSTKELKNGGITDIS